MSNFPLPVILLIALVLVIGIPALILILIYRLLAKRGYRKLATTICLIALSLINYEIFRAFYPADDFYLEEFKTITLNDIPRSADIIEKSASYPDIQGNYTSASLIKLSRVDYDHLKSNLSRNKLFKNDDKIIYSKTLNDALGDRKVVIGFKRIDINEFGYYYFIGFLKDNQTILVYLVNI